MTIQAFIQTLQGYYAMTYPQETCLIIARYLERWSGRALDELASLTIKRFSGRYGKLPDVAVFEEYSQEVCNAIKYLPVKKVLQIEDKSELATPEELEQLHNFLAARDITLI